MIIVAKSAGFCFGVNKAVEIVYNNISKKNLYTYGPIIHNTQVVEELESKGVKVINDLNQVKEGTIIIRSHGVSSNIYKYLEEKGLEYIDATCPYVKRIHNIVNKHIKEGHEVIIIGNPSHPEVIGINGWCQNKAVIIENIEQAKKISLSKQKEICIVSQTTFDQYKFNNIVEVLKNLGYNLIVFSTICNSTYERQNEALKISKKVDKMIVIGGKHSSNTQKLYNICKQYCKNTYHIETVKDLSLDNFNVDDKIGITAGASTPENIIEEVITTMNEIQNENLSFEELLEQTFIKLESGTIIKGTVIQVSPTEVIVNVGYKSDGIITKNEYTNAPNADLTNLVKEGDEIEALVLKINDKEGQVLLSKKRMQIHKGFQLIQEVYDNKQQITAKVNEIVKAGVIVLYNEVKIFIPASQLDDKYINDLSKYIDQDITFRIIDFNSRKGRVIGSRRVILEEEKAVKKQKALEELFEGAKVKGVVKRITNYGAFVDLNGIDALLHVSEMAWKRVKKPQDIVSINQKIEVLVKKIDKESEKISLTLKFPEDNPWNDAEEKYKEGTVVDGTVVRLTDFGAFVELEKGVDSLLHVSQISKKHIDKPKDILNIGDKIKAQVVEFKKDDKKISISMKVLEQNDEAEKSEVKQDTDEVVKTNENE